jgi:hypothetical protein
MTDVLSWLATARRTERILVLTNFVDELKRRFKK